MPEPPREHHISSAVISVLPRYSRAVAGRLAALADTEVHHRAGGKIVVVMEGPSQSAIGARLAEIALMDHVLSANLVYQVVETASSGDASHGAHEA